MSASSRRAAAPPLDDPVDDERLGPIVRSARELFRSHGVAETRMDDVAEAAGMTRQNLYRYVSGKTGLVELATIVRGREIAEMVLDRCDPASGEVADALIDAIIEAVLIGREDDEFGSLLEAIPRVERSLFVTGTSPMHEIVRVMLAPIFARARSEGVLRTDVSEDRLVEWLQGVMTLLNPRVDLDRGALADTLRDFVVGVTFKPPS